MELTRQLVRISDRTLVGTEDEVLLSFREKIEYCKLVDRLNVSVIQLNPIQQKKIDSLLIKSVCTAVRTATVAVPVTLSPVNAKETWEALKGASHARLQVSAPVSSVQMEYLLHKKPAAVTDLISSAIRECRQMTEEVEFIAEDATRSEISFLCAVLREAVHQGAGIITICDNAGSMAPDETAAFIKNLKEKIPELNQVTVGFSCANTLYLADACAIAAVRNGARELKAVISRKDYISLPNVCKILKTKGSEYGVYVDTGTEQMNRSVLQMGAMFSGYGNRGYNAAPEDSAGSEILHAEDSRQTVLAAAVKLGYDLNDEDQEKIWNSFLKLTAKKPEISFRELDAIIAAEAMQVPSAYHDIRFAIQTDHSLGAMAHVKMKYHEEDVEGVSAGDGVVDAAFMAIEKAIGRHLELDGFQIQAITEGQAAMGETIVKLRNEGKLYSGRGLSTDITGASVMAYINALNKIVFEEEEE